MINKSEEEIMFMWDKGQTVPLVTIWCACFNHERFITQCLDGLLSQITKFPFEIVVHDDCSSDNSIKIIQDYYNEFPDIIRPIYEEENQYSKDDGSLEKIFDRNIRGKYIAFCEGDDYWCYEYKLQKQVDFMENNNAYVGVGHLTKSINKDGEEIETFIDSKSGEYTYKDHEKGQLFAHVSSWFLNAHNYLEFVEAHFNELLFIEAPSDRVLPIMMLSMGKLYVLDGAWSAYRFMSCPTSYTSNKENTKLFKIYSEYESLRKFAQTIGTDLDYDAMRKSIMFNAFVTKIKHPRDKEINKILKLRSNPIADILWCVKQCFLVLRDRVFL